MSVLEKELEQHQEELDQDKEFLDKDINKAVRIGLEIFICKEFGTINLVHTPEDLKKALDMLTEQKMRKAIAYLSDWKVVIKGLAWQAKSKIFEAISIYHQVVKLVQLLNKRKQDSLEDWEEKLFETFVEQASKVKPLLEFDFSEDLTLVHKFTKQLVKCLEDYWALKHFINSYLSFHNSDSLMEEVFHNWEFEYCLLDEMHPSLYLDGFYIDIPYIYNFEDKCNRRLLAMLLEEDLNTPIN